MQTDLQALLEMPFDAEKVELSRLQLIDCRRRIANGDMVSPEELAENLLLIRKMYGREAQTKKATVAKPKKAASVKKGPVVKIDADAFLNDLMGSL